MVEPTPGYDDQTIIPQHRALALLDQCEKRLETVQKIFEQHLPGEFHVAPDYLKQFWDLRAVSDELDETTVTSINELITNIALFEKTPSPDQLKVILGQIKRLKKLIKG